MSDVKEDWIDGVLKHFLTTSEWSDATPQEVRGLVESNLRGLANFIRIGQPPKLAAVEVGWLVEVTLQGIAWWWTGLHGTAGWSDDSYNAVRFARKKDAEVVIGYLKRTAGYVPPKIAATEHQWEKT